MVTGPVTMLWHLQCPACGQVGDHVEVSDPGVEPAQIRCGTCEEQFTVPVWEPTTDHGDPR